MDKPALKVGQLWKWTGPTQVKVINMAIYEITKLYSDNVADIKLYPYNNIETEVLRCEVLLLNDFWHFVDMPEITDFILKFKNENSYEKSITISSNYNKINDFEKLLKNTVEYRKLWLHLITNFNKPGKFILDNKEYNVDSSEFMQAIENKLTEDYKRIGQLLVDMISSTE